MSLVQLSRLIRTVAHEDGVLARLRTEPDAVLAEYDLTPDEEAAVLDLDGQRLIDLGVNPLLMRTLLVLNGVGNPDLYSHSVRLPGADADAF
jgi:Aromatic-ring-opening dioxygenase LigAB, LigA subunit